MLHWNNKLNINSVISTHNRSQHNLKYHAMYTIDNHILCACFMLLCMNYHGMYTIDNS